MQLRNDAPQVTFETFPSRCRDCSAPLGGRLVQQTLLTPEDVVELLGAVVSVRTVRSWLRKPWSGGVRLAGARHRVVRALEFVAALDDRKQHAGRARLPVRALRRPEPPRTTCPRCERALGGFVARLDFLTVPDIAGLLGLGCGVIDGWIRSGRVRGFKIPGIRGVLVEENDFFHDFEALMRDTSAPGPALGPTYGGRP
jgi:hypothetical protein